MRILRCLKNLAIALGVATVVGVSPAKADVCTDLGLPAGSCTVEEVAAGAYELAQETNIQVAEIRDDVANLDGRVQKLEQASRSGNGADLKTQCQILRLEVTTGIFNRAAVPDKWVKKCKALDVDLDARNLGTQPTTAPAPAAQPAATGSTQPQAPQQTGTTGQQQPSMASLVMVGPGRDCQAGERELDRPWCVPHPFVTFGVSSGGIRMDGRYMAKEGEDIAYPVNDRDGSWVGGATLAVGVADLGGKGRLSVSGRVNGGVDLFGGAYAGGHVIASTYVDHLHYGSLGVLAGYEHQWMGSDYNEGRFEVAGLAAFHANKNLALEIEAAYGIDNATVKPDNSTRVVANVNWTLPIGQGQ